MKTKKVFYVGKREQNKGEGSYGSYPPSTTVGADGPPERTRLTNILVLDQEVYSGLCLQSYKVAGASVGRVCFREYRNRYYCKATA